MIFAGRRRPPRAPAGALAERPRGLPVAAGLALAIAIAAAPRRAHAVTQAQYEALVELYASLGGAGWEKSSGWLEQDAPDDYDAPCTKAWYGVLCEENGGEWSLVELDLGYNGLAGEVPESIAALDQLRALDLSDAGLVALPESLGELAGLQSLAVRSNALTALPESLSGLTELWELVVSHNPLPRLPDLDPLTSLTALEARGCLLQGELGEVIGDAMLQRTLSKPDNDAWTWILIPANAVYLAPEYAGDVEYWWSQCCTEEIANLWSQTLAPHDVGASAVADTSLTLEWTPTDLDPPQPGGYRVYVSEDGGATFGDAPVAVVEGKESGAVEIASLTPSTAYVLRVESFTLPHESSWFGLEGETYWILNTRTIESLGNDLGDNRVEVTTLAKGHKPAEERGDSEATTGGVAGAPENGCACAASGDGGRWGPWLVLAPALRRRRRSGRRRGD